MRLRSRELRESKPARACTTLINTHLVSFDRHIKFLLVVEAFVVICQQTGILDLRTK